MTNFAISLNWYNEIKDLVPHGEPELIENMHFGPSARPGVEVDVDEDIFRKVSTDLGWM